MSSRLRGIYEEIKSQKPKEKNEICYIKIKKVCFGMTA